MGVDAAEWWTTDPENKDNSAAWEQAIRDCYLDWELTKPVDSAFSARIRHRMLGDVKLIECQCGPCSGRRVLRNVSKDGEPYIGIQIVVSGSERFRIGSKTVGVEKGALVFWNSFESTEFEVRGNLHKVTLLLPQSMLESRLQLGMLIRGGVVETQCGVGSLLFSHIRALADQFNEVSSDEAFGVKWASIELGATAALGLQQPTLRPSKHHLVRIQRYILEHLQDPELSVPKIADENSISVRYVHALFVSIGRSVSKWILERRLERCRDALAARTSGRCVVKDVAFQWGFSDTAHFSRVFKRYYNLTPYEYWLAAHGKTQLTQDSEGQDDLLETID